MNQHVIDIVLTFAGTIGLTGITRFAVGQAADAWFKRLHSRVEQLVASMPFDCATFHKIQETPRPWYVKLNSALERRHI